MTCNDLMITSIVSGSDLASYTPRKTNENEIKQHKSVL